MLCGRPKKWLASVVAAAIAIPIAVGAQADSQSTQQASGDNGISQFTFMPDDTMAPKYGLDQHYYMSTTTDKICADHRYSGDISFENTPSIGHHNVSDNYYTGETRSISTNGGKIYIHAAIDAPGSQCENGARFSPIANHSYEIRQRFTPADGSHYYCSLFVADKQTHEPPTDLAAVNFCKWRP